MDRSENLAQFVESGIHARFPRGGALLTWGDKESCVAGTQFVAHQHTVDSHVALLRRLFGGERIESAARELLASVRGVDAAFLCMTEDGPKVYAVAPEHHDVNLDELVAAEDHLCERFGTVEVGLRAHQGRGAAALFDRSAKRIL